MTKRIIIYILVVFLSSTRLIAQNTFRVKEDIPHIEVIGKAERLIEPDEIYISIKLKEKIQEGNKISVESQETKLKTSLTEIGINISLLSLSDANTETIRISKKQKKGISSKTYTLKVSTANEVRKTFEVLDRLDINESNIIKTDISNKIELMKSIRIEAIKAAKIKAEYLLEALDLKIDKPILIKEVEQKENLYMNYTYANSISNTSASDVTTNENSNEITIEKIKLSSDIYIEYSIK